MILSYSARHTDACFIVFRKKVFSNLIETDRFTFVFVESGSLRMAQIVQGQFGRQRADSNFTFIVYQKYAQ